MSRLCFFHMQKPPNGVSDGFAWGGGARRAQRYYNMVSDTVNCEYTYRLYHYRDAKFWVDVGKYFVSSKVIKELGGIQIRVDESDLCWVAYCSEQVVGFALLSINKNTAKFKHDYVFPNFRRNGIYKKLMEYRIYYCLKQNGIEKLKATCTDMSVSAFLNYGFTKIGNRGKYHLVERDISKA